MAEAGFQWIFSVDPQGGTGSYYSGLALALVATTVAGAVVIVPVPLSAPAISPAPPALQESPRDSLDPTWGRTQFAELGLHIGTLL